METYELFGIMPKDEEKREFVIVLPKGLAVGKIFASEEEAKKYIDSKPWELIVATICYTILHIEEKNKEDKGETA